MILDGKRVLITGGTGSLGKALLARSQREGWDTEFTIFSRDETKQGLLRNQYPRHRYILGDIASYMDLKRAMRGIDVVFHFAAYKQIPSAQNNVGATVRTNIIGSQNVVDAAIDLNVEKVVASSTDKAMSPVNMYGATKLAMEYIFQDANKYGATTFHLARYGNVVASNASVAILWQQQAAAGGPLTVTDKRMTRFFLTLDQALDLVLLALNTEPGVIVVPKAPAIGIYNMALAMSKGLPIIETGIRAGEKIHEGMISEAESFYTDEDEAHYYVHPPTSDFRNLNAPFSYTSDKPVRWLEANDILDMVRETQRLYGN